MLIPEQTMLTIDVTNVRILVLFYTVNFTTYSSKVDYTILTLVPRHNTLKTKLEGKKGLYCEGDKLLTFTPMLIAVKI